MSRIVLTSPVVIPATPGQPAVILPKGTVLEATAAMLATIAGAGGTTRPVSTTTMHDVLGEAAAAGCTTPVISAADGTGGCGDRNVQGQAWCAANSSP